MSEWPHTEGDLRMNGESLEIWGAAGFWEPVPGGVVAPTLSYEKGDTFIVLGNEGCVWTQALRKNLDSKSIPYTYQDFGFDDRERMLTQARAIGPIGSHATFPVVFHVRGETTTFVGGKQESDKLFVSE